jgi:rhamnosyltransferase
LPDIGCSAQEAAVSVLIPTLNGENTIAELMAMLAAQTADIQEILIIDSGSQDNTVELVKRYGATVFHIEPENFNHGGSRNFIAQKAQNDIVVFLTQDTIPRDSDSVEKLIHPLLIDSTIVTTYGRQLPAFDADHFAASLRKFNYPSTGVVRGITDTHEYGLRTVFTSNSFACYRRSFLEKVGYFPNDVIFGEDTVAVGRLLQQGEKIAYVAEAVVYHSHNYSPVEEFKRYFDIGVLHSTEQWLLDLFGSAAGQGKKYLYHEVTELIARKKYHLLPEMVCRIALKFCGYKLGRNYKKMPRSIVSRCSMHRAWWKWV